MDVTTLLARNPARMAIDRLAISFSDVPRSVEPRRADEGRLE
jgi:hypothetical protein